MSACASLFARSRLAESLRQLLAALLLFAASGITPLWAATVVVLNQDGPNEGFNDPTPFTPVGGNTAITLGQARLNAFQYAANLVGALLTSSVPISVEAFMDPLGSSASGGVLLGSAGPITVWRNFTGAPVRNTWYPVALASSLRGVDNDPTRADVRARFNSDIDNGALSGRKWHYGFDGNAGGDFDFVAIVLHELVHGFGFSTQVNLATGAKLPGSDGVPYDDAYMRHLEHHGANPAAYPAMSDAQRVAASTGGDNLHWTGPATVAAAGLHVYMYGPNPQQPGSSVSHISQGAHQLQLMWPSYGGVIHDLGLAKQVLNDIGWTVASALPRPSGITVQTSPNSVRLQFSPVAGATGYRVYYGSSSGSYTGIIDLGNSTDKAINAPAATYYGALTAYNSTSESGYSAEGQVIVPGTSAEAGE